MDWLWQGVFSNWLADVGRLVVIVLLGAIAAFIKARFPRLGTLIWFGLGVCTLLIFIFGAFKFIDTLPPKVPQVTLDNVEAHIRTWLDHFELGACPRKKSLKNNALKLRRDDFKISHFPETRVLTGGQNFCTFLKNC